MKQRVKNLAATAWDRIRYGQDENAPTGDEPLWPLHLVIWFLLPLAIIGAGVLSATATVQLAADHAVEPGVRPFLVFMIEVVALAATLLTIFSTKRWLRVRAMVLVVGVTLVAMVAGWHRYQGVGLLAGILIVYLIHLAAAGWLELRDRKRENATMDTDILVLPTNPTPDQSATELLPIASGSPAPGVPPDEIADLDADLVARATSLLAEKPSMGRPTLLAALRMTHPDVKDHTAKRLLRVLRPVKAVGEVA